MCHSQHTAAADSGIGSPHAIVWAYDQLSTSCGHGSPNNGTLPWHGQGLANGMCGPQRRQIGTDLCRQRPRCSYEHNCVQAEWPGCEDKMCDIGVADPAMVHTMTLC